MTSSGRRSVRTSARLPPPATVTLKGVPVCGFLGRKAEAARTLSNLPVSEPRFESETIQFYGTTRVPFDGDAGMELNRELGKIGVGHTLDREKLLLDSREAAARH